MEDTYSLYDYGINVNDPIQVVEKLSKIPELPSKKSKNGKINESIFDNTVNEVTASKSFKVGDIVDAKEPLLSAWFEARIERIIPIDKGVHLKEISDSDFYYHIKYLE